MEEEAVPSFDFITVFFHKKVANMHDEALLHRVSVDRTGGSDCWVRCSCNPMHPWKVVGGSDLEIQQSFERHLNRKL